MTRSNFIAAAAVGLAGIALQRSADAELVIAKVAPDSAEQQGFTVKVARSASGVLRFDITHGRGRNSGDEYTMRLAIGRGDEPVVVCALEPKRVEIKGDPVFRYTFDLGEKSLKDATLDLHVGGLKRLGGEIYQFDLAAFAAKAEVRGKQ